MRPDRLRVEGDPRSDRIWIAGGVALAVLTLACAAVEIRDNDGVPKVNGGGHLALFSQPARSRDQLAVAVARPVSGSAADDARTPDVDFEATATISKRAATGVEPDLTPLGPPTLERFDRGIGMFRTSAGLVGLKVGDPAPGGGVIKSFRRRDGRWVAMVARTQTSR